MNSESCTVPEKNCWTGGGQGFQDALNLRWLKVCYHKICNQTVLFLSTPSVSPLMKVFGPDRPQSESRRVVKEVRDSQSMMVWGPMRPNPDKANNSRDVSVPIEDGMVPEKPGGLVGSDPTQPEV